MHVFYLHSAILNDYAIYCCAFNLTVHVQFCVIGIMQAYSLIFTTF